MSVHRLPLFRGGMQNYMDELRFEKILEYVT